VCLPPEKDPEIGSKLLVGIILTLNNSVDGTVRIVRMKQNRMIQSKVTLCKIAYMIRGVGHPYTKNHLFLICIVGGGVQTGSTRHVGHLLAYCTCPG
jgi:hypothetical protein